MSDDRLELEALRAQLYDATKDIQLWGSCDPSNEERLFIHKIQIVLDDWLRCVDRRIHGDEWRDEDQHCDEHPSQFLHFYKKASEVRGSAVGKHLGRLAENVEAGGTPALKLVKARPIRRVSQAPPPLPRPIQPTRGRWIPSKPKPAEIPSTFPPNFPPSLKLKTNVILAGIVKEFPDRSKLEQLCRAIVSGLTILLCKAAREGVLKAHAAPDQLDELLHYVRVENCNNANERFRVERAVKNSGEWHTMLKQLAECEDLEPHKSRLADRTGNVSARRKRIDDFIGKLSDAGHRITRKDIWLRAGYNDRTEFQRFQREDDERDSSGRAAKFNRVLDMSPEVFIEGLNKRRSK